MFKFTPEYTDTFDENENNIMDEFTKKLESYVVEESTHESLVVSSVNNNFYELRKRIKIKSSVPETKFDSLTFKN